LFLSGSKKHAGNFNRFIEEYDRFMLERTGGRLPWSMKNPPQGVIVSAGRAKPAVGSKPPAGAGGTGAHGLLNTPPPPSKEGIDQLAAKKALEEGDPGHVRGPKH
jgi:hypothetical protein